LATAIYAVCCLLLLAAVTVALRANWCDVVAFDKRGLAFVSAFGAAVLDGTAWRSSSDGERATGGGGRCWDGAGWRGHILLPCPSLFTLSSLLPYHHTFRSPSLNDDRAGGDVAGW